MLQQLINFLLSRHTVDGAMSHFNKAIAKLRAVERQEVEKMNRAKEKIQAAEAKLVAATHHATVARNRSDKLTAIFGETPEDTAPNINTLRAVA